MNTLNWALLKEVLDDTQIARLSLKVIALGNLATFLFLSIVRIRNFL